jgi:hypothetical protein
MDPAPMTMVWFVVGLSVVIGVVLALSWWADSKIKKTEKRDRS